jgi:hypothetical protein
MKTEREKLEENTHMAKAKQTGEELGEYYKTLIDTELERLRWTLRASSMLMFTFGTYWLILILMLWQGLDDSFVDTIAGLYTWLFIFGIFRDFHHENRLAKAVGETRGCEETLRILGYLPPKGGKTDRRVRRQSPYERFKEFWERVGKKNNQEAYA